MSQTPQNIQNEGVRENDFDLKTTLVNTDRIRITTANDNYNMTWDTFKEVSGWNAREQRIQSLEQEIDNLTDGINGVVEGGSNANGSWVKFPDGTLIQYGIIVLDENNSAGKTFTLPTPFLNANYALMVSASAVASSGTGASLVVESQKANSSSFRAKVLTHLGESIVESDANGSYIAIGRWK